MKTCTALTVFCSEKAHTVVMCVKAVEIIALGPPPSRASPPVPVVLVVVLALSAGLWLLLLQTPADCFAAAEVECLAYLVAFLLIGWSVLSLGISASSTLYTVQNTHKHDINTLQGSTKRATYS